MPKELLQIVLELEVEADATDDKTVRKIIRHLDNQISGLPATIRVGDNLVEYQVVSSHGQQRRHQ